ncbi:hypothetical protein DFH08DRAFT_634810, partial [Mycena albidolilacea]
VNGKTITPRLLDVLYAPTCAHNLVSVGRLDDAGMKAEFINGKVAFFRRSDGRVMAMGHKTGRLYPLAAHFRKVEVREGAHAAAEASNRTWDAWH